MAEATLTQTEVTPPEDVALTTPEATPEQTPAPDNQEDDAALDAILEGFGDTDAQTGIADGKGATTDGTAPAVAETLTPEQAKEEGRRERDAEIASQQNSVERQNYINGLNFVVKDVPEKLTALAERYNMAPTDVTELYTQLNRYYGALKPLSDHALQQASPQIKTQAYREAEGEVSKLLFSAVAEDLGEASEKAIRQAAPKTWPDLAKAITKEARKGYISVEKAKEDKRAFAKKIDTALKERGGSLADITGNGGINLPPPRSGSGGQPKDYAEAEAWHASGKWDNAQMRQYRATHSRN